MNGKKKSTAVSLLVGLAGSNYSKFRVIVAKLLSHINPQKPLGTELFDAVAKITPSVAIEAQAFRRDAEGMLWIFLRRRAMDDTAYPGEWHAPGSVLRSGETIPDVLNRLTDEYGGVVTSWEGDFVGNINLSTENRGHFFTPVYLVDIEGDGREDDTHGWFPVDQMPRPLVEHHEQMLIPMARKAFEAREWQNKEGYDGIRC